MSGLLNSNQHTPAIAPPSSQKRKKKHKEKGKDKEKYVTMSHAPLPRMDAV